MAVVVSGLGVVSPLGCSAEAMGGAVAAGRIALPDDDGVACEIPLDIVPADKRSRLGRLDRLCRLLLTASHLAVDQAGLDLERLDRERLGLSFGTGLGCLLTNAEYWDKIVEQGRSAASPRLFAYTVSSAAAGEVSIALGIHGPNVTAHMGLAAGLGAVGYASDLIELGKADVVLAAGGDAGGAWLAEGLHRMGLLKRREQARPFADAIPGVWPSEGAAVAVLSKSDRSDGSVRSTILGYAAGFEPTLTRRSPSTQGLVETVRRALAHSSVEADEVDVVVTSAHGTPLDEVERRAVVEVYGERPLVLAPKAALGETFAAAGVLDLALMSAWLRQPPSSLPGIAFDARGRALLPDEAANRLRRASVVALQSVCYSGNLVCLVLTRRE